MKQFTYDVKCKHFHSGLKHTLFEQKKTAKWIKDWIGMTNWTFGTRSLKLNLLDILELHLLGKIAELVYGLYFEGGHALKT